MKYIVLGTAGHIDHGKSSLVKALTGMDPDRLKEEKERGITLDLGFASLDLPGGDRLGIVDVPGHEGLIKNMLAGVGGIGRSHNQQEQAGDDALAASPAQRGPVESRR